MLKGTSSNARSYCGKEELDQPPWPGSLELPVDRTQNLAASIPGRMAAARPVASSAHGRVVIPRPESERIEFLLQRDGREATRAWVERTSRMYRDELARPASYASDVTYRPRFEQAVREFEEWLTHDTLQ
jgi:hypothetical protein